MQEHSKWYLQNVYTARKTEKLTTMGIFATFRHQLLFSLRLFICSSHLRVCTTDNTKAQVLLFPCQSVCKDVFDNCYKYFLKIKLPWPHHLNCSSFPRHPSICIKPPSFTTSHPSSTFSPTAPSTFYLRSSHFTLTSKPPSTTPQAQPPSRTPSQAQDTDYSSFIFFLLETLFQNLFIA